MTTEQTGSTADLDGALRRFAAQDHVLVALDFDGVLAPIVVDRDAARPLPEAAEALRRLATPSRVELALVSGRTLEDLRRLADPPPGALLVASHGAEVDGAPPILDEAARALLADVLAGLRAVVEAHPATELETKPAGGVLHTRRAARDVATAATDAVLAGPASLPGVHALRGKEVVELSVLDTDKGRALDALRRRLGVVAVLYAGDDVTDEHAFRSLSDGDVGIKIGEGDTAARWRVADPPEFAVVLHRLADLVDG